MLRPQGGDQFELPRPCLHYGGVAADRVCRGRPVPFQEREPLGDGPPHPPPVGGPQAAQTHIAQKGGGACQAPAPASFPVGTALLGYSIYMIF